MVANFRGAASGWGAQLAASLAVALWAKLTTAERVTIVEVMRTAMKACCQADRVLVRRRHVDHMRISTALCCGNR